MRRGIRIALICAAAAVASVLAAVFIAANYMVTYAMDNSSGSDADFSGEWMVLNSRTETITSRDGLELYGYFIPAESPSEKYVILVHGYKSAAVRMTEYARHYHSLGWNVLAPEHRAHGRSSGRYITMGSREKHDIIDWAEFLASGHPESRILLHGVSMGAATVMLVTGEAVPSNVVAAVEDCGYTGAAEQFTWQLREQFHLPYFPVIPAASLVTRIRVGYTFGSVDCIRAVSRSSTPTLFIHGDRDTFVPFSMLERLYSAASCDKDILVVPGAGHADSVTVNPELYWTKVDSFAGKYLR